MPNEPQTAHDPGPEASRERGEAVAGAARKPMQLGKASVRIGTASWTDPTMVAPGVFYPPDAARWSRPFAAGPQQPSSWVEQGPGRRTIAANDAQRQADEIVRSRLDLPQVDSLEDDDPRLQEGVVRGSSLAVGCDREVIGAHQRNATRHQRAGCGIGHANERVREFLAFPERRVACLEEQAGTRF